MLSLKRATSTRGFLYQLPHTITEAGRLLNVNASQANGKKIPSTVGQAGLLLVMLSGDDSYKQLSFTIAEASPLLEVNGSHANGEKLPFTVGEASQLLVTQTLHNLYQHLLFAINAAGRLLEVNTPQESCREGCCEGTLIGGEDDREGIKTLWAQAKTLWAQTKTLWAQTKTL